MYYDLPSKYTKLEENFGGFKNKSLVRFEFEKSPLHTIVHGATGTGKAYFVKQYLKLYLDQDQNQNQDKNQDQKSMMGQEQGQKQMVEHGEAWTKFHDRMSIRHLLRRWRNMAKLGQSPVTQGP